MSNHNNITELRGILFNTLRGLENKSIDIDRAKAISETAQVIINSAKVEADHARYTKQRTTMFMHDEHLIETGSEHEDGDEPSDINSAEPKLVTYVHHMGGRKEPIGSKNGKR